MPSPYPDVNAVLTQLLTNVQTILGDEFVGLYLYGSLADGDFVPERSDIDFVVTTAVPLPQRTINQLEAMHKDLWDSNLKWAKKLEGSYIPLADLRRYDYDGGPYPQVNEGRFFVAGHGYDWVIQRWLLRERPFIMAGPDLKPFIDPVTSDDLVTAVTHILHDWWEPMITDPTWLKDRRDYQAFATMTMCRALYVRQHGEIVSKTKAIRWAQANLPAQWQPLIGRAAQWPTPPQPDELDETVNFIRYVIARG